MIEQPHEIGTQEVPSTAGKRALPPLALITLTVLIDMIGFGIVLPILPLYSQRFGAPEWQIGLLLASFSAMQLIFAPILGKLSDKYGRRPVLLISVLGTSLGFLIMGFAHTLALLFIGRIIDGMSGANIPAAQAYIADVTPAEKRSRAMGIIGAAFGLGFMVGPAIGGLLGTISIEAPFLFASALAFLNAIGIFFLLPQSLPPEKRHVQERPSLWQTLRSVRGTPLSTVMACALVSTIAFSLITALYTLFTAHRFGWGAHENGWMFTYIGFLGVLIQGGLLGRLIRRFTEKPLIIAGTVSLLASTILLPLSFGLGTLVVASSLVALGNSLVTPLLNGWASRTADPQSQGVIMGLMQSIASLARMLGPALGGFLLTYDTGHPDRLYGASPFWSAAALLLLAVYLAVRLQAASRPVHVQEAGA